MNKVLLCVLDGVGLSDKKEGNALYMANTPNIDNYLNNYPNKPINASGNYVGLPNTQMGNSEVGHLTIGAGRIIYQSLQRINNSIKDNSFFLNEALLNAINNAKKNNSKLHVLGLLSDGGVHSHIDHIKAVLELCDKENFNNVYLHIFTDGRDTYNKSAIKYIDEINDYNIGTIATISGRYYAMDRDKRFDRIEKAYDEMVYAKTINDDYHKYINNSYENAITDEFIIPSSFTDKGKIEDNDSIIWCNFRADRAIEILSKIINEKKIYLTTMMYVSDDIKSDIAFKKEDIDNTLGIYLSKLGKKQLRIAETEKYAHVTYFFDGGKDIELDGEKRILIPSSKVATYDLKPEMSAIEITDALISEMDNNYDFILLNFANGDMVGHTGNLDATIKAVETIDKMLGKIYEKCNETGYTFIITADHGNCENMINNNSVMTSHTTNKVPFIVLNKVINIGDVDKLSDIAPFILKYMDIKLPKEMQN